jgi:hypothetical protein
MEFDFKKENISRITRAAGIWDELLKKKNALNFRAFCCSA